jgi:hypothetical protein
LSTFRCEVPSLFRFTLKNSFLRRGRRSERSRKFLLTRIMAYVRKKADWFTTAAEADFQKSAGF